MNLIDFSEFRPTEQKLKQLDRHKLLPKPKLKRLGKAFETLDQLLLHEDDSQRIKECVRSILIRYDDLISCSAYRDIEIFKTNNPSKRFEFASTVELHIVYAQAWCKSCLEANDDIYSQRKRLHNIAKIEAAKFLKSAVKEEVARRESSLPQHSLQIDCVYKPMLLILPFLALSLSFPAWVLYWIKTDFSIYNRNLNENDRKRMINSSVHKKYNKVYKCTTKQLLNSLGVVM